MADIRFRPFQPSDLKSLVLQDEQRSLQGLLADPAYADALAASPYAWTGTLGDTVCGCAGLLPQWQGRALAWALLGVIPPMAWVRVVAKVRRVFAEAEQCGIWRIDTAVRRGFMPGWRLAEAVGMQVEGVMRSYGPDQADHWLFARVREW